MDELTQLVRKLAEKGMGHEDLFADALAVIWPLESRPPKPIVKALDSIIDAVVGKP